MTQLIPFEGSKLPSFLRNTEKVGNLAAIAAASSGFPVVSIKGKVFTLKRGDEKTLITKPDAPDEPASNIEVVVIAIGPAGDKYSKAYYGTTFTEGSDEKPVCYSNDGIAPAVDSVEAQAKKCALCKHNQFGSRVTDSGGKGKACADTKRLAIAQVGAINDPMLVRIPAASLKPFREYAKLLASRGITESQAVVTKIGFDYTVAHPQLTFKPVGFVDEATYLAATAEASSDVVKQIIGESTVPVITPQDEDVFETLAKPEAPAPEPVAEKPKAEPKPKPEPVAEKPKAVAKPKPEPELPAERAVTVRVDDEPKAAKQVSEMLDNDDTDGLDFDFDD